MEKIQKALERARQHRKVAETAGAERTAPGGLPGAPSDAGLGSEPALRPSATRVHAANDGHLLDQRVFANIDEHALLDTFRILRTQVLHRLASARNTTLAITSPGPGEGKSLVAVNLAISMARRVTNTVLLVDVDLRRPSLHEYFGITPAAGLSDHLLGDTPLADCLVNPGLERLVILPAGRPVPASSELLAAPKMLRLSVELKSRYPDRLVIYDLPPLLVADDALAFVRHVDACLLVVEDGRTRKEDLQRSIDLLNGCNLIGTVLNKSTEAGSPSRYYY